MEKTIDRAKLGRRSREKGKRFELEAAKFLSSLIFNDETILRRTPRSGAAFIYGDTYYPPDPHNFPIIFEFKKEEGWELHLIFNDESIIWNWWKQVTDEQDKCKGLTGKDRVPILVFSKNWYPMFIMGERAAVCDYFEFKNYLVLHKNNTEFLISYLEEGNVTCQKQNIQKKLKQQSSESLMTK